MANNSSEGERVESSSSKKKALLIFVIGALIIAVLFYFFKEAKVNLSGPDLSQDSFQGPAELSSAVQTSCQDSAKKISEQKNCFDKEAEFLKNAENCLNVYYNLDSDKGLSSSVSEGNYGDLSLEIAKCYSTDDDGANATKNKKSIELLQKINAQFDWDIYMGPISCDSKSTLGAHIEMYSEARQFKCFKVADLPALISELKNKNFQFLKSTLSAGEIAHQGLIEADVACPETLTNIEKNLSKLLSMAPFEITEPKLETGAPDDIFIEITKNKTRLLNLQFKIKAEGCLHFQSLLAPSTEVE